MTNFYISAIQNEDYYMCTIRVVNTQSLFIFQCTRAPPASLPDDKSRCHCLSDWNKFMVTVFLFYIVRGCYVRNNLAQ